MIVWSACKAIKNPHFPPISSKKPGCFSEALKYSVVAAVDGNNENICILA